MQTSEAGETVRLRRVVMDLHVLEHGCNVGAQCGAGIKDSRDVVLATHTDETRP
jgi:bacterioferritin-associated ferredoxin